MRKLGCMPTPPAPQSKLFYFRLLFVSLFVTSLLLPSRTKRNCLSCRNSELCPAFCTCGTCVDTLMFFISRKQTPHVAHVSEVMQVLGMPIQRVLSTTTCRFILCWLECPLRFQGVFLCQLHTIYCACCKNML